MIRRNLLTLVLFIATTTPAAASAPEPTIDLALSEIGTGSAAEIRARLLSKGYTIMAPEYRQAALAELPEPVRRQRITGGSTLRRAEKALQAVLELYDRHGTVEVVLYRSERPQATLYRGCVLVLSEALAGPLTNPELLGVIAHEIGHTYYMGEMNEARRVKDTRAMKAVELKCDAIALISLKLLGQDAGYYLVGLRKREKIANGVGLSSQRAQTHPNIPQRQQFLVRLEERLDEER